MKRTLAVCLCAALLLCLLAGCTEEIPEYIPTGGALDSDTPHTRPITDPQKPEEKQISLAYNAEAGMNPLLTMSFTNRMLFTLIYQGLFTVNNEYECSPILCKNYNVTSDMKTYTFYLEEAYFSDGTALTAADVVASLEAARSSDYYGGRLQHVDSITAYGDVVVIELDTPMENLPILLDIPIIKADEIEAEQPLGTGPYRVDGEKLKRQAGWWCTASLRISCDEIPLVNCTSAAQVRDAFELGGVGMACADQAVYNRIPYHGDYELWDCENGLFLYLGCNSKSEIFSNEAVRSTLTYAIDRDKLVETYYGGFAYSASLPASPLSPYYSSTLAGRYDYEPQRFYDAVAQSGLLENVPEGEKRELRLLVNSDDRLRLAVAEEIAGMLEKAGFAVKLVKISNANFVSQLRWGTYDLYLAQTKLSANMDLSAFYAVNGSLSYGGMTNAELYFLSTEALANSGNYSSLHEKVMEDGQLCPILFQSYAVYVRRATFSDLAPARDAVFYYDLGRTMADALLKE